MFRIDFNMADSHRRQIDILHRVHEHKLSMILVPHFYKHNQITEKDYCKWLLDETGEFMPELINTNKKESNEDKNKNEK